jgi:hypothetical protein
MPSTKPVVVMRVRGEVVRKLARGARAAGTAPTVAGYRYTAVLADRSEVTLRANAARRYEWAYQWAVPVVARKNVTGLAAYFTYSSRRIQPLQALAELRVEWPKQPT